MESIRVLIVGETPLLIYILYSLTKTNWPVTYCDIDSKTKGKDKSNICIEYNELDRENVSPLKIVYSLEDLRGSESFDLVIFGDDFSSHLHTHLPILNTVITRESLIFMDCNNCPWLYEKVTSMVPNFVLVIQSTINLKRLTPFSFQFKLIMVEPIKILVGIISLKFWKDGLDLVLNYKKAQTTYQGLILGKFRSVLDNLPKTSVAIISHKDCKYMNKIIWKNIISIVCFHSLSVIFEETNALQLSKLNNVVPLMKGSYKEVLKLCSQLCLKGIPTPDSPEAKRLLQLLILIEGNSYLKSQSLLKHNFNSLEANLLYYNFVNGYTTNILNIFNYLLNLAFKLEIDTPFLESINSFLLRLYNIKVFNNSKIFHIKQNMVNYNTINGISPDKNMMNYPPFNNLPLPKPPTQFVSNPLVLMSTINDPNNINSKQKKDNESIVSIDSKIQNLISSNDQLRNEIFYDTSDDLPSAKQLQPPDQAFAQNNSSDNTLSDQQMAREHYQQQYHQQYQQQYHQQYHQEQQYYQQQYYQQHYNKQYQYQQQHFPPQGHYQYQQPSAYPNNSSNPPLPNTPLHPPFPVPMPLPAHTYDRNRTRKPPSYHRLLPTINRNTSVDQLRESHDHLLNSIKFDNTMDHLTSSRYGKYDTSTAFLNIGSVTNSSNGTGSESSTSTKRQR